MVVAGRDELVSRRLLVRGGRKALPGLEAVPPVHAELESALCVQPRFVALGKQEVEQRRYGSVTHRTERAHGGRHVEMSGIRVVVDRGEPRFEVVRLARHRYFFGAVFAPGLRKNSSNFFSAASVVASVTS